MSGILADAGGGDDDDDDDEDDDTDSSSSSSSSSSYSSSSSSALSFSYSSSSSSFSPSHYSSFYFFIRFPILPSSPSSSTRSKTHFKAIEEMLSYLNFRLLCIRL